MSRFRFPKGKVERILKLSLVEKLTYSEISDVYNMSRSGVASLVSRYRPWFIDGRFTPPEGMFE